MNATQYRDLIEQRFYAKMTMGTPEDGVQTMRKRAESFRNAFGNVVEWFPPEQRPQLASAAIGTALLGNVNAVTLLAPSGDPVIIFDFNLANVCLSFCKSLSREAFIASAMWRPDSEYVRASRAQRMEWFFDNLTLNFHLARWWLDQDWRIGDISERSLVNFYQMFAVQTWFILAHECAHIVLGHVSAPATINHPSPLLGESLRIYSPQVAQEFDADVYAWKIIQDAKLTPPLDTIPPGKRGKCIDALFSLFVFLEGTGASIHDHEPLPEGLRTHPPSIQRGDRLRCLYGYSDADMDNLRGHMLWRVSDFRTRWPRLRHELKITDGLENVDLL